MAIQPIQTYAFALWDNGKHCVILTGTICAYYFATILFARLVIGQCAAVQAIMLSFHVSIHINLRGLSAFRNLHPRHSIRYLFSGYISYICNLVGPKAESSNILPKRELLHHLLTRQRVLACANLPPFQLIF